MDQKTIDKYNPTNFRALSKDDIDAMRQFTLNDVADLAKAYPNKPTERAYLVLFDKTDRAKQLYPLSTWANLYALWKQQLTKYIAFNFSSLHNNRNSPGLAAKTGPVQDLTQAEVTKAIKSVPGKQVKTVPIGQPQTPKVVPPVVDIDPGSDSDFNSDSDFEQLEKEAIEKTSLHKKRPVKKSAKKK